MAHTYIRFDFGNDEEKAQQARHKLDGWRQAFRLDKRVQYKMDRPAAPPAESPANPDSGEKLAASAAKTKGKAGGKPGKDVVKPEAAVSANASSAGGGKVGMLVRLYFSSHEKLSEQRWLERIPSEEPFKGSAPKVIAHGNPEFEDVDQQFETLT